VTVRYEGDELNGNAATRFAETQLEEIEVDVARWTKTRRDPRDGSAWLIDYPMASFKAVDHRDSGASRVSRRPVSGVEPSPLGCDCQAVRIVTEVPRRSGQPRHGGRAYLTPS